MKYWDKILDDFARKCKGGSPDMTNPRHLALLRESLIKFGWNENAMNGFIGNLRNGKEVIVEKRKPGETWKTKSGWAGLKAGQEKARYGMGSKRVAVKYVKGEKSGEETETEDTELKRQSEEILNDVETQEAGNPGQKNKIIEKKDTQSEDAFTKEETGGTG